MASGRRRRRRASARENPDEAQKSLARAPRAHSTASRDAHERSDPDGEKPAQRRRRGRRDDAASGVSGPRSGRARGVRTMMFRRVVRATAPTIRKTPPPMMNEIINSAKPSHRVRLPPRGTLRPPDAPPPRRAPRARGHPPAPGAERHPARRRSRPPERERRHRRPAAPPNVNGAGAAPPPEPPPPPPLAPPPPNVNGTGGGAEAGPDPRSPRRPHPRRT